MEIGRLCVKIAGRDAGLKCVIVDIDDKGFLLIDGQTRRRKCNPRHLEPLNQTLELKKGAAHTLVVGAFKKLDIEIKETKAKPSKERPKKVRKTKIPLLKKVVKKTKSVKSDSKDVAPKEQSKEEKPEPKKSVPEPKEDKVSKPAANPKSVAEVQKDSAQDKQ